MKKLLFLLLIIGFFASCSKNYSESPPKSYSYPQIYYSPNTGQVHYHADNGLKIVFQYKVYPISNGKTDTTLVIDSMVRLHPESYPLEAEDLLGAKSDIWVK